MVLAVGTSHRDTSGITPLACLRSVRTYLPKCLPTDFQYAPLMVVMHEPGRIKGDTGQLQPVRQGAIVGQGCRRQLRSIEWCCRDTDR